MLVAEDNPVNQQVASAILEHAGHEPIVAANGREVLALLDKEAFDLVLMDVQMPEMDGLEATAAIRERERGTDRHVPIVALTAHAMKGDAEKCLAAGMDGYLAKPLQLRELTDAIARVVPGAGRPGTGPAASVDSLPSSTRLDTARLLERVGGDRRALARIVRTFRADFPKQLAAPAQRAGGRRRGRPAARRSRTQGRRLQLRRHPGHRGRDGAADDGRPAGPRRGARARSCGSSSSSSRSPPSCSLSSADARRQAPGAPSGQRIPPDPPARQGARKKAPPKAVAHRRRPAVSRGT